jgi:phosphoribosylanthranilate isomerase
MTRIKICGITRAEDAHLCVELGVEFVGFVFVQESPRCVDAEWVGRIASSNLPLRANRDARDARVPSPRRSGERVRVRGTRFVGVFRNQALDDVRRIADAARLDIVQLHGDENEDYVRALEWPVIKAVKVEDRLPEIETAADYVMFDSGGGTGRTFDWTLFERVERTKPFFLAGGLTAGNVREAIERARPDVVDVSSGVESAPGIKDQQKIREFIAEVRLT